MPPSARASSAIRPTPTDEEAVAIMAATEALWPRPIINGPATPTRQHTWRFSGRWWARPVPARRDRPYR